MKRKSYVWPAFLLVLTQLIVRRSWNMQMPYTLYTHLRREHEAMMACRARSMQEAEKSN